MILRYTINQNSKHIYLIFNKPFNVLSQFTKTEGKLALSDFLKLPKDVYPVGRLDYDSEGLLILTNDNYLKDSLLNPLNNHQKKYLVQVEGIPSIENLIELESGVKININGNEYLTKKCNVKSLDNIPNLPPRIPPIRFRESIPTSWLEIQISEGKNRQIRKMTAKVGLPTLRLIRSSIENLVLDGIDPGKFIQLSKNSIYKKLNLKII
jgi:23S rRNA pseudouridine2457 synthase